MCRERNFRFLIQYDGRPFCGWQRQPNGTSVQQLIEEAIESITGVQYVLHGSGRTDSGVHALGQVASSSITTRLEPDELTRAINAHLPPEIRVVKSSVVPQNFHARFSAVEKTYRYLILQGDIRSPFAPWYACWINRKLDEGAMADAAQYLTGEHDFAAFMGSGSSVKTTVRTIKEVSVRRGGGFISIMISADGFLKHMVRNICGTLIEAGKGVLEPGQMERILLSRDRTSAGPTAPAEGLTLIKVTY
jgi:tRNA pseudouridine38-40 synthase